MEDEIVKCDCHWCSTGKEHPTTDIHSGWVEISPIALMPEALLEKDFIFIRSCSLCGHKERIIYRS